MPSAASLRIKCPHNRPHFAHNHSMKDFLPVVICVGTVRVSGDSLGPIVGDILSKRLDGRAYVYGTTQMPVNGVNLEEWLLAIDCLHKGSIVIAVDAAVGAVQDVGKIRVLFGGVKAGGALNKNLPKVGHIGVTGIVAARQSDNLRALMDVPQDLVAELSAKVAARVAKIVLALGRDNGDTTQDATGEQGGVGDAAATLFTVLSNNNHSIVIDLGV